MSILREIGSEIYSAGTPDETIVRQCVFTAAPLEIIPETDLTWAEICEREPRLLDLLADAGAVRVPAAEFWRRWRTIKREAERLVGWGAARPSLRTWQSYNTATDKLLAALENAGRQERGAA